MDASDALQGLDANYLEASRIFVSHCDRGEYLASKDAVIVSCGFPVESLNFGFLLTPYRDLERTAADVRGFFDSRRLRFQLLFREQTPSPQIRELEAEGWRRKPDPLPGMTLALPATPRPAAPGLEIRPVRTREEMIAFRETAFRGFGYPVAAAHLFLNEHAIELPGVRMFSGWVDGAVVSTAMLIATGGIAGIYFVATLEEHRGRGYGEALTWAAVEGGSELGCRVASLQASKLGRPVYARMGFAHVLDYPSLSPPEP
jgi:GNAT superfamily N-acetyltransferase